MTDAPRFPAEPGRPAPGGPAEPPSEAGLWRSLGTDASEADAAAHWLALLATWIEGTRQAALILRDGPGDAPRVGAVWPGGATPEPDLAAVAELVLRNGQPTLRPGVGGKGMTLAHPYLHDGHLRAVVALHLPARMEAEGRALLRNLRWAGGWLEAAVLNRAPVTAGSMAGTEAGLAALAVDVLASEGFEAACRTLATGLCPLIGADRISVIWFTGSRPRLVALSHAADVNRRLAFAALAGEAAAEAADQRAVLFHPGDDGAGSSLVTRAQADFAARMNSRSVLSVPLMLAGRVVGALVADAGRDHAFSSQGAQMAEAAAAMLTPALDDKRRIGRGVRGALRSTLGQTLKALFGPDRVKLKLVVLAGLALVLAAVFATAPYQIVANARIEGREMRWLVAPFDGYIEASIVRPGQSVAQGEVVAALATDDMRLERLAQLADLRRREIAFAAAQAEADRGQMNILRAEMDRDRANLALLEASIARAELRAPFDAVVVEGDLRDRLGAPVSRGDQLLGLAPRGSMRVTLLVRDSDIDELRIGQEGLLRLAAVPGTGKALRVLALTPVTEIEDGTNVFRAEAEVMEDAPDLRPGMAGVARLEVDRRRVVAIWTKDIADWMRLRLWAWMP